MTTHNPYFSARLQNKILSELTISHTDWGFPGGANGKEPTCHWFEKIPWRRACNPLQYYSLENPMGLQRVGHGWGDLAHTHTKIMFSFVKQVFYKTRSQLYRLQTLQWRAFYFCMIYSQVCIFVLYLVRFSTVGTCAEMNIVWFQVTDLLN